MDFTDTTDALRIKCDYSGSQRFSPGQQRSVLFKTLCSFRTAIDNGWPPSALEDQAATQCKHAADPSAKESIRERIFGRRNMLNNRVLLVFV